MGCCIKSIEIVQYNLFFNARYIWFGHIISSGFSGPHHNASITSSLWKPWGVASQPRTQEDDSNFSERKTVWKQFLLWDLTNVNDLLWGKANETVPNLVNQQLLHNNMPGLLRNLFGMFWWFIVFSICYQNVCNPTPQEMPNWFRFGLELMKGIHFWTGPFPHESMLFNFEL